MSHVKISRREILSAGLAAAIAPHRSWAIETREPDVIVVGAGAAGLAAARIPRKDRGQLSSQ